jgi:hypothetical protein
VARLPRPCSDSLGKLARRDRNGDVPETQVPAATPDGFVTYDELKGPDLDAARLSPARLPLPTGGEHIPLDPNAELAVGEGEVRGLRSPCDA